MNRLDHIVIAADTVEQGVAYLRERLGVEVPRGGCHQTMGTHNHLMQLGNTAYLELIAIDPSGEVPAHPRWFELDDLLMRTAIAQQPRLITWVMNTLDIQQLVNQADFDIGRPTTLSRDALRWEITLTDDGRLLNRGLLPYCIQWHSQPHPAEGMADLGCRLQQLTLHHNRSQWLTERLIALGADHLVTIETLSNDEAPYLSATIDTPTGTVIL